MFMNSPALIGALNNAGPLRIVRADPPEQNATGGFDAARTKTIEMNPATVVTGTGRDLDRPPEADRNKETICVYVTQRLFVQDGGRAADVVCWADRSFRVIQVRDYSTQGGVYMALAELQEPGELP